MQYGLYVIYDKVAKESGFPFDAKNDEVAIRKFNAFIRSLQEKDRDTDYLNEFELKYLCTYNAEECSMYDFGIRKVDFLGD